MLIVAGVGVISGMASSRYKLEKRYDNSLGLLDMKVEARIEAENILTLNGLPRSFYSTQVSYLPDTLPSLLKRLGW